MRKVGGLGLGWVGIPLTLLQVTGGECSQSERALLGSGRLLALWKANSQPPTIGTDPREGSTNKTRVWQALRTWSRREAWPWAGLSAASWLVSGLGAFGLVC